MCRRWGNRRTGNSAFFNILLESRVTVHAVQRYAGSCGEYQPLLCPLISSLHTASSCRFPGRIPKQERRVRFRDNSP